MPSRSPRIPSYRLHKPSGRAVVTIDGCDIYLGPHGSAESHDRYHEEVALWQLQRRQPTKQARRRSSLTMSELFLAFWDHAQVHYRKDGAPTSEISDIKVTVRELLDLYGKAPVETFGPLALKTVREAMIERDLCRTEINQRIGRIKRMFKWGVANELVKSETFHALQAVTGLQRGRTTARESTPVRPAPDELVQKVLGVLSTPVAAMVRLQMLTGMRPGEVVTLRPVDVNRSNERVWIYIPSSHKTEHHGRERRIFIGPQAQMVLQPFLDREPTAFCFSPREAIAEQLREKSARRATPIMHGNRPGTNRKANPKRQPRERYDAASYRRAIGHACNKLYPKPADLTGSGFDDWKQEHRFHPHQMRHNAATYLAKTFGIEAAQVVLGHSSLSITQIYAERDFAKAAEIMRQVG